jgi:hypothetical protein
LSRPFPVAFPALATNIRWIATQAWESAQSPNTIRRPARRAARHFNGCEIPLQPARILACIRVDIHPI